MAEADVFMLVHLAHSLDSMPSSDHGGPVGMQGLLVASLKAARGSHRVEGIDRFRLAIVLPSCYDGHAVAFQRSSGAVVKGVACRQGPQCAQIVVWTLCVVATPIASIIMVVLHPMDL